MFGSILLLTLFAILAPAAVWLRMRRRVDELEAGHGRLERLVQQLTARVYALEESRPAQPAAPAPLSEAAVEPEPAMPLPADEVPVSSPASVPLAQHSAPEARDWEAVIGGNWLNKAGALILVVGIGLFLAYSLAHLGPAGKVAIGFAVGVSMLAAGVTVERRPDYVVFGRSLIGGGWAAIYFTTYAMHGLPAARLVDDPAIATVLLLGVSLLMLIHALRYSSEPLTALAYLIAFVTLNITPLTSFGVAAALFLSVSLAAAAWRWSWHRLAIAGVALAYGTFALGYEPSLYGRSGVLNGQSILWIYWLLFEGFDLLHRWRGGGNERPWHRAVFYANAAAFLSASALHEWSMRASEWAVYFALGAFAYAASASLRWQRRDVHSAFHGAAAIAGALAAAACVERFSGIGLAAALLIEGEFIVVLGMVLRDRFLRGLGATVLGASMVALLVHAWDAKPVAFAGREWRGWTPLALLTAAVFFANRWRLGAGYAYPAAGSALLLWVTGVELPRPWVAPVWSAGLLLLLRVGLRHAWTLIPVIALHVLADRAAIESAPARLASATLSVAAIYVAGWMTRLPWVPAVATLLLTALLQREVQGRLLTVAWGIEAVALVVCGFLLRDRILRISGLAVFVLCVGKLFFHDLRELDTPSRILSFIVLGLMLLAASWLYTRFREQIRRLL